MLAESIKAQVSIRDLFDYYGIKVKGRTALCPLHPDKRPSMSFKDTGLWYCFVCGVGGDIIKLVMLVENLTFKESLHWLNDKFSLGLTDEKPKKNYYLEALNENYQTLKDCFNKEFNDNCENHYRLMELSRGMNYPYLFWEKNDFNFEMQYDKKQNFIEAKLRELENARFKLRRTASQNI